MRKHCSNKSVVCDSLCGGMCTGHISKTPVLIKQTMRVHIWRQRGGGGGQAARWGGEPLCSARYLQTSLFGVQQSDCQRGCNCLFRKIISDAHFFSKFANKLHQLHKPTQVCRFNVDQTILQVFIVMSIYHIFQPTISPKNDHFPTFASFAIFSCNKYKNKISHTRYILKSHPSNGP